VSKAGLAQDVIVRASATPFPAPSEWGLSDETTHLVVMTEFFTAPEPTLKAARVAQVPLISPSILGLCGWRRAGLL